MVDDPKALERSLNLFPRNRAILLLQFLGWMNEFIMNERGNCADILALLSSLV